MTKTIPASSCWASCQARASSRVQIAAVSPYSLSLAIWTASSSSANRITQAIGPNISSRAIRISGVTSANTVGATQNPSREALVLGQRPWVTSRAPSSRPISQVLQHPLPLAPVDHRPDVGGGIEPVADHQPPRSRAANRSRNSSWIDSWTRMRAVEVQASPWL